MGDTNILATAWSTTLVRYSYLTHSHMVINDEKNDMKHCHEMENHPGAGEESNAGDEGEVEEGRRGDGGGRVQQQDHHQGEGQVRGGQGEG